MVALAYYLAFRLRFENGFSGSAHRYGDLLWATLPWVVPLTLVVLAAFGQYQRLWTFVGQRDYEAVVKGMIVATLVAVGAIALFHPVAQSSSPFLGPVFTLSTSSAHVYVVDDVADALARVQLCAASGASGRNTFRVATSRACELTPRPLMGTPCSV